MCCIFFTFEAKEHSLILASNRDEFLARPTRSAGWHHFDPSAPSTSAPSSIDPVLSGIDADPSGGGTWLGITTDGRWAALTNFTEPAPPPLPAGLHAYRSRGALVRSWLSMTESDAAAVSVQDFVEKIARQRDQYPGFNLLIGRLRQGDSDSAGALAYVTNRNHTSLTDSNEILRPQQDGMPGGVSTLLPRPPTSDRHHNNDTQTASLTTDIDLPTTSISPSLGLSNSVLHEPWQKVRTGRAAFDAVVSRYDNEQQLIDGLFDVMATANIATTTATRQDLQCTVLVPPIQLPTKKDPQQMQWYATRTSTILLVKPLEAATGFKVTFVERDVHDLDTTSGQPREIPKKQASAYRRFDFLTT